MVLIPDIIFILRDNHFFTIYMWYKNKKDHEAFDERMIS